MTIQGATSAATSSVTIPTHAVGDLIFVFTRRTSATPPTMPGPDSTTPTWTAAQSGGAGNVSLISAWAIATAANHTTGTWINATHICVLVLRPDSGKALTVATSSTTNGGSVQTIVYPALTLSTTSGTSWGVRSGTRSSGDDEVANAPSGWTNRIVQPAGVAAVVAVHTQASLTANPTLDTVNTTGVNAAYRANTMEVTEQLAPVLTQQPMAMII